MLILLTAFLLGSVAGPSELPPSATTQLVLTIDAYKNAIVLYEPVSVTIKLKNPTEEMITSNVRIGGIEYFITGPDGKTKTYHGREALADGILREVTHEPGSTVFSEDDLGWKGRESVFPVPGEYEIRARVYAGDRPTPLYLESNRLRIEVRQPTGANAEAIATFPSEAEFKRLLRDGATAYCEGDHGPACFEQLARFVDEHRSSAYAPGITRNLADAIASGHSGVQSGYDVAVRLYKAFLKQWPTHPNAPSVMYCLAMTLDKAGRSNEATEAILEFEKKFPERKEMTRSLRTNFQ
jgi:hypothetical protein